jgi:cobalt-zinc-cadmium efflux system membrane fusion protein
MNIQDEIRLNARISFDENNVIRVFSPISGKVEVVKISLGSYVKKDQELAVIRSSEISEILKDYKVSKANLDLAEKNLKIAEGLYKSNFSSELEVLTARKEYQNSKDEFRRNSELVKLYEASVSNVIPRYTIKSPVEGYIVEKNITNNMQIRPDNGNALFTISDLKKVWVLSNVYEEDIAEIKTGQSVTIEVEALPGKNFDGIIENVNKVVDSSSRVIRARIILENNEELLKPGMFAMVKVHIPQNEKLFRVSSKAILFDKDHYFLVELKNNKYIVRQVKVAKKNSDYVFIYSGIQNGAVVVKEGSLLIYNELVNQ